MIFHIHMRLRNKCDDAAGICFVGKRPNIKAPAALSMKYTPAFARFKIMGNAITTSICL